MPEGSELRILSDAELDAAARDTWVVAEADVPEALESEAAAITGEAAEQAAAYADDAAHGGDYGYPAGRSITHPPELPHFIVLWFYSDYKELKEQGKNPYGDPDKESLTLKQYLHVGPLEKPVPFVSYAPWENHVFLLIGALFLCGLVMVATKPFRSRSKEDLIRRPTRMQSALEGLVGGARDFVIGILGEENGRRYLPFVGTMFFLILVLNLMGIIPLMRAPTASLLITASLALVTFVYYQSVAWVRLGPGQYIYHLAGQPKTGVQWALAPLIMLIEIISDFIAKPLSLALRLFGNILGKDILLGVMLLLGLMISGGLLSGIGSYVGLPLTFPFYFLAILLSTIQALVFAMLSAIYILLVLPHDHEHGHDENGHAEAH